MLIVGGKTMLEKMGPRHYMIKVIDNNDCEIDLQLNHVIDQKKSKSRLEEIDQFTQQFANLAEMLDAVNANTFVSQVKYDDIEEIAIIHASHPDIKLEIIYKDTPSIMSSEDAKQLIGREYRYVSPYVAYAQQKDPETAKSWQALKERKNAFYIWRESIMTSYRNRRSLTIGLHRNDLLPQRFYNEDNSLNKELVRERSNN